MKIEIFIDKEQEIEGASWQGVSLVTEEQDLVFNYRSGKAISGGFWSFTLLYSGAKNGIVYSSKLNERGYIVNHMGSSQVTEAVVSFLQYLQSFYFFLSYFSATHMTTLMVRCACHRTH